MNDETETTIDIEAAEVPQELQGFDVTFSKPLDCADIFPEGGEATGAKVLDEDGRFTLIGAGNGRVVGEISELSAANAAENIRAAVVAAANL